MESSHWTILPPLVIPAQAGIQVCFGELAWIPAFAGMTETNRYPASCYHSALVLFEGGHEAHDEYKTPDFVSFVNFVVNLFLLF